MNQVFPLTHPASTTIEKCWYCKAKAHPSAAIKVEMAKYRPDNYSLLDEKNNLTYPLFTVKIVFINPWRLELYVPRCLGCRFKHGLFKVLKRVLNILFWIFLLYLYFYSLILFGGFVVVSLVLYGLSTRLINIERRAPDFLRRQQYNYAFEHTEIYHLYKTGWTIIPKKNKIKKKK